MAERPERRRTKTARGKVVHARFSDEEYAAISTAAAAADMTVSSFLRSLSLEGAGVEPFLSEQDRAVMALLVGDMRAIGGNLNQVARALNSGHRIEPDDLKDNLRSVEGVASATLHELRALAERGGRKRRREA